MKHLLKHLGFRRGVEPSLYHLRCHLLELATYRYAKLKSFYYYFGGEDDDKLIAERRKTNLDKIRAVIEKMDRITLVAVIGATKNPEYNLIASLLEKDQTGIRDHALYFETLEQSDTAQSMFSFYLGKMSRLANLPDLAAIHQKYPLGSKALLRLVMETMGVDREGTVIHPGLVHLVLTEPHRVEEIIDFLDQRELDLLDLDPQIFLDAMDTETRSLRDGIL